VSSLRRGRVLFRIYPQDHEPRHVHGFIGTTEVADRVDCIRPGNAKRSDIRALLDAAAESFDELVLLWEKMHA
jgi:hypothetical protein